MSFIGSYDLGEQEVCNPIISYYKSDIGVSTAAIKLTFILLEAVYPHRYCNHLIRLIYPKIRTLTRTSNKLKQLRFDIRLRRLNQH